jgi:hypothetical protein
MSGIGLTNNSSNVEKYNDVKETKKNDLPAGNKPDAEKVPASQPKGDNLNSINPAGKSAEKIDLFSDVPLRSGDVPAADNKINFGPEETKSDEKEPAHERRVTEKKGTLSVGWGYGWQTYAPSDMHFQGPDHDFTLYGVKANDRPSPFSFDTYFNPTKVSIPQYMMDLTYFPTNNIYVELNPNHHMKWVSEKDQMVKIDGHIDPSMSQEMGGTYNGEYVNTKDMFRMLEHTNGYNYVHAGVGVIHPLWESKNGQHALSIKGGVHGGVIVTKTEAYLFGKGADHPFTLDGVGFGVKTGLRLDLFKHFFVEGNSEFMQGHLWAFPTTGDKGASASQTINTINNYFSVGYQAPVEDFNPKNWFKKKD